MIECARYRLRSRGQRRVRRSVYVQSLNVRANRLKGPAAKLYILRILILVIINEQMFSQKLEIFTMLERVSVALANTMDACMEVRQALRRDRAAQMLFPHEMCNIQAVGPTSYEGNFKQYTVVTHDAVVQYIIYIVYYIVVYNVPFFQGIQIFLYLL